MIQNEKEKELRLANEKLDELEKEAKTGVKEKALNILSDNVKRDFPGIEFEETLESIEKLKRKKHRCYTCRRYTKQVSIELIDLKLENSKEYELLVRKEYPDLIGLAVLFRLFDNPNEQLEDSKGYCVTFDSISKNNIKTKINTPKISVCSEWGLHPDIGNYLGKLGEKLVKIREKRLAKEKIDTQKLIEYEKAKKVIADYNSLTVKRGRGRPSSNPSKKTYFEE